MKAVKFLGIGLVAMLAGSAATAQQATISLNACYQSQDRFIRVVHSSSDCRADEDFVNLSMEGTANPGGGKNPSAPVGAPRSEGPEPASASASEIGMTNPAERAETQKPVEAPGATSLASEPGSLNGLRGAETVARQAGPSEPLGPAGGPHPDTVGPPPAQQTGAWGSTTAYIVGNEVTYNGRTYLCVKANTGVTPGTSTDWQLVEPPFPSVFGSNSINFTQGNGEGAQCTLGSLIVNVATEYAPNYLPADGRLIPINTNTALFSLIGINYGGNGTSNFGLPDLRAAAPTNTNYLICVLGTFP